MFNCESIISACTCVTTPATLGIMGSTLLSLLGGHPQQSTLLSTTRPRRSWTRNPGNLRENHVSLSLGSALHSAAVKSGSEEETMESTASFAVKLCNEE